MKRLLAKFRCLFVPIRLSSGAVHEMSTRDCDRATALGDLTLEIDANPLDGLFG